MTSTENNMYKIEVVKVSGLNKSTKSIRVRMIDKKAAKDFAFTPGQFIIIGAPGYDEAVLSITTVPTELPEFEVVVKSVGAATQALHRLKVGDTLYFRGPMGNTIMPREIIGHQLVLVAGGIGLAPLHSLIHSVRDDQNIVSRLTIVCGAKTPDDLLFKNELKSWEKFAEVHITVDEADRSWTGEKGRVDAVLSNVKLEKDAVAVVCGPQVMYKTIAKVLLAEGLAEENIHFMLERRMKCGIGKCQHCTCGGKYVCLDGPTFAWKELRDNWEAFR